MHTGREPFGRKRNFQRLTFSTHSGGSVVLSVLKKFRHHDFMTSTHRRYVQKTVDKIRPVDLGESDGSKPLRDPNWRIKPPAVEEYEDSPNDRYRA